MIRRRFERAVAKVVVRLAPEPMEIPEPESPAFQAEIEAYQQRHWFWQTVEATGWMLWVFVMMPAFLLVGLLERVGFGPWLRAKLGTGK